MEACMPEIKKKPKPPKPFPKPTVVKTNDQERPEKPTPLVPQRPADTELSQTQYRMKKATSDEAKGNLIETPVVPPRPTEKEMNTTTRYSQRRRIQAEDTQSQSEVPKNETDFKQSDQSALTGLFRRSQKEKTHSFTSYLIPDKEDNTDNVPAKKAPGSKPVGLKGVMKGLQIKSSPKASREPSPDSGTEEEKEQAAEKNKPKQDIGGLIAGMFRKAPKEKSSSPAVTVHLADSDSEDAEEAEDKEWGGFFSGIRRNSNKARDETPAQDNLSVHSDLSASSDSLSENGTKEKGGIFKKFKKSPKATEAAQTDEDRRSLHDDLSGSNDDLSENSKEKGGFFSGILRKSPKIPGEGTPGQDKQSLQTEPADDETENSSTKEKGNVFSGIFKKSPKLSAAPRLEEGAETLHSELSASTDSLTENKEKGGLFSGLLRKTPKTTGEENLSAQKDLSASNDSLSEAANTKEKGIGFSGLFKKSLRPADSPPAEEETKSSDDELTGSSEALYTKEKGGGLFSGLLKKTPKASGERTESPERDAQEKNIFSNMFKKPQKTSRGSCSRQGAGGRHGKAVIC
ncbi:nucleolar protein dao-5-like [Cottoperca gobio]|uniref:Nucleolar protein dao-5-like n=1 Tax=Cottoperca gobio TaxID=56716 RepID=A0A6J2REX2_COTGO|nr:nucleolar protein dao-5-like [Cottoperca gobio]